jgi:hypothetical protein
MAELTLKTRLLNKMSEGTIADLRKGEINFYPAGDFLVMEVGGTDKPFAAKASDVAAWAKEAVKPVYTADEIDGLANYIAGKVEDTNTTYTFEITADTGELVIKSHDLKGNNVTVGTFDVVSKKELDTVLADYVTSTALSTTLESYLTNNAFNTWKVENATAIAEAKAEGTAAKTALNEYKTANDAALAGVKTTAEAATTMAAVEAKGYAVATDVAGEIERVEGLVTAEASRADAAEKKALADAKAYADGLAGNYDAKGAAAAAEAAAKAYADGLAVNYDEAGAAATAEANAKDYADEIKAALLGDDLTTTFDTLKAVQDWVDEHGEAAADLTEGLANETKAREEADTALSNRIKAYEDVKDTYATKSEVEAVSAVADAAQTADEVASAIDTKIAALDLANTYDAKGAAADALTEAKKYANSLEHKDTTYTAGTGLKLDGTVFSIDTDLVFILDANA